MTHVLACFGQWSSLFFGCLVITVLAPPNFAASQVIEERQQASCEQQRNWKEEFGYRRPQKRQVGKRLEDSGRRRTAEV